MFRKIIFGALTASTVLLVSCSGKSKTSDNDSTPPAVFHADYDIAMITKSLADAINVGEVLDSADYNFIGILTDGTGRPLYTTPAGHPGRWRIEVQDSATVRLKNLDTGDLMVEDLRNYLVEALNLSPDEQYEGHNFKNRRQTIYSIPNGYLSFTEIADTTANDSIPRYLSIILQR